jgi:hypothetical protein
VINQEERLSRFLETSLDAHSVRIEADKRPVTDEVPAEELLMPVSEDIEISLLERVPLMD